MKSIHLKLFMFLILGLFAVSCSKSPVKLEFSVIDSIYNVAGVDYDADYCKMQILENPQDKGSKVIDIPVIRIRTGSKQPGAPVFILNDGPGYSNFVKIMPTWLVENHDVIIIGYRGVDGSVNLNLPEVNQLTQNSNFLSDANLNLAAKAFEKGFNKLADSLDIDLNQYNIVNMAYDLESARLAFHYEKINIFAVGFGARIAQIYSKIAPNAVFRIMMERPKAYGSLALNSQLIENVLEFYNPSAREINNNTGYSQNIIRTLASLPAEHNGYMFDKDKIVYSAFKLLETLHGAALVNEAFLSAGIGDYESLKYLEELYSDLYPSFNLGDYAIKSVTSEFNQKMDYSKEFSYNSTNSLGSPLAKFIYAGIQKSGFKPEILPVKLSNPDSLAGECLMITANLDLSAPFELAEFELKPKYSNAVSIILSDYNSQALHTYNIPAYSDLISNFLYSGNYKSYVPEMKSINLKPEKTLKQLAMERIQ